MRPYITALISTILVYAFNGYFGIIESGSSAFEKLLNIYCLSFFIIQTLTHLQSKPKNNLK